MSETLACLVIFVSMLQRCICLFVRRHSNEDEKQYKENIIILEALQDGRRCEECQTTKISCLVLSFGEGAAE